MTINLEPYQIQKIIELAFRVNNWEEFNYHCIGEFGDIIDNGDWFNYFYCVDWKNEEDKK